MKHSVVIFCIILLIFCLSCSYKPKKPYDTFTCGGNDGICYITYADRSIEIFQHGENGRFYKNGENVIIHSEKGRMSYYISNDLPEGATFTRSTEAVIQRADGTLMIIKKDQIR